MDGKKKRNKKKKGGSQSKLAEDVQSAIAEEAVVPERDNGAASHVNHLRQVSSMTDVQSVGVSESDIELDRHKVYEERFVKLQEEVRQLQEEKSQWLQKEISLEEKVKLLQNDVDSCIKKEAGLEEKLKKLQSGNDSFIQKEVILEDRVKHVEGIKHSWISKETMINEMASKLEEVDIRLQVQVKELKESRDCLIQENTQLRESIAVMKSRVQRIETEVFLCRSSTAMSPAEEMPHYQCEAVPPPLVEKREPEMTELVEKEARRRRRGKQSDELDGEAAAARDERRSGSSSGGGERQSHRHRQQRRRSGEVKEVHIESDQQSMAPDSSSTPELDIVESLAESAISIDYAPECGQEMYPSGEMIPYVARARNPFSIPNGVEDFGSPSVAQQGQLLGMDNSRISEDIVSVPLDDNQVQEVQPTIKEEEPLPISDAPLIGAPFRLISFFAKYVSGADLAHQDGAR